MTESRSRNNYIIAKHYLYHVNTESYVKEQWIFNWFIKCISNRTNIRKTWCVYNFMNMSIDMYPYMLFIMYDSNDGTASLFELVDVDEAINNSDDIDEKVYIDLIDKVLNKK